MERFGSGRPLEEQIGFSRVVVAGRLVAVSGCAPTDPDGSSAGGDDPYRQAQACLEVVQSALAQAGGSPAAGWRTRIYMTRRAQWPEGAGGPGARTSRAASAVRLALGVADSACDAR